MCLILKKWPTLSFQNIFIEMIPKSFLASFIWPQISYLYLYNATYLNVYEFRHWLNEKVITDLDIEFQISVFI